MIFSIAWWQESLSEHWMTWATFAGYLVVTWLVAALSRRLMLGVIPRLTSRSQTKLDDRLVRASARPLRGAIYAVGFYLALARLIREIPSLQQGNYSTLLVGLEHLSKALVILGLTAMVNALMKAGLDWYLHDLARQGGATWDRELLPMVKRLGSMLIYFIGFSIILEEFGFSITALITTAGVASLAIALAAQETLSNMLGGFVILVDRPFRIGDVIELSDGKMGTVIEIGLRSTRIRQFDGNALVVPNKDMASTRVINLAQPTAQAAIRQTISLSLETDIDLAKRILLDVMQAHPDVLDDPAPGVWFTKFNGPALDLFMSCWVETYTIRTRVTDELNSQILRALREHGIALAIPRQEVFVHPQ